jgi:hypothetical protein
MGLILLLIVGILILLTLPGWWYARNWGYGPSGTLGLVFFILVVMLLLEMLPLI